MYIRIKNTLVAFYIHEKSKTRRNLQRPGHKTKLNLCSYQSSDFSKLNFFVDIYKNM